MERASCGIEDGDCTTIGLLELDHSAAHEERLGTKQATSLFVSHALSTWNARTYEFAAILFTAAAFPDTLLMSSLRGLAITLAALLGSSAIGAAIDGSRSRLRPLLYTIIGNRLSIVIASGLWFILVRPPIGQGTLYGNARLGIFASAVCFGAIEKLTGIGNMICSERNWVPELADRTDGGYTLTVLNSVMRRIDLVCKLVAPLVVSIIMTLTTMRTGVMIVGAMSAVSCGVEIVTAKWVWDSNERLRRPKPVPSATQQSLTRAGTVSIRQRLSSIASSQTQHLYDYFGTDVWQPSLALALLHLSALSYAATLTTYLLNVGYSLLVITVARALGSVVEVSSTFIAPVTIQKLAHIRKQGYKIGNQREPDSDNEQEMTWRREHSAGLARSGLWGITLQWACLVPVLLALWQIHGERNADSTPVFLKMLRGVSAPASLSVATVSMFFFLSVSRLGLWMFDLTTQEITQTGTEAAKRSSFAGTEMAFASLFELSQWVLGAVFPEPEQFRWLALGSFGAVSCSALGYALWVRQQRGHLVHWHRVKGNCFHSPRD